MFGSKPTWNVEVHDGVEPVEEAWKALAGPNNATPFQTFGLMKLFYRQLGANRLAEPVIVLVRHPDGRPAALFPLMRSKRHGLNWLHSDAQPIPVLAAQDQGQRADEDISEEWQPGQGPADRLVAWPQPSVMAMH
jgi:CelD/BcsL family acetyltransferase involved in cellulose biosynthesis